MFPLPSPLLTVGASSTPTASVRSSNNSYINSASSIVHPLPSGVSSGDECIIFIAHGFTFTTPSGWSKLSLFPSASGMNGGIIHKQLTSGDISTGSVTVSFAGSANGFIAAVAITGAIGSFRTLVTTRTGGASSTTTLTTGGHVRSGDLALCFGAAFKPGPSGVPTTNIGSALTSGNYTNIVGAVTGGSIGADGAVSAVVNYGATNSGDIEALLVIVPVGGTPTASAYRYLKLNITAVPSGGYTSIAELQVSEIAGGTNAAQEAVASASSDGFGLVIANINDGTFSTVWHSGSGSLPEYAVLDFGEIPRVPYEIRICPRGSWESQSPKDFSVSVSNDNVSYSTLHSYTGQTTYSDGTFTTFVI